MDQNNSGHDQGLDAKERGPVIRFFLSGWTNLVRLMASNVLFFVFNIPAIALAFVLSFVFIPVISPVFIDLSSYIDPVTGSDTAVLEVFILLLIFSVNAMLSGTLICIGPFQAGFAQVYKDIRNNTSVSFISSFGNGLKMNWKKGLAAMLIGFVITPVLLLAISFYLNMKTAIGTVIGVVFIILLFAFILIQNFVYTLIVSTELKLGKIYKNAFLFLFVRFLPCLAATVCVLVFYFVIPFMLLMSASYLTLGIFILLYSFFAVSWVQYFLSCFTGSLIEKYVALDNGNTEE